MPEGYSAVELGTLAVQMTADIRNFRANLEKAISLLKRFKEQTKNLGISIGTHFENMGASAGESFKMMEARLKSSETLIKELRNQVKSLRAALAETAKGVSRTGKEMERMGTRGKYGLGALLTFQQGVRRFITMNMRWFLTWRSFWFIWNQILAVGKNLRDLFDETAYALRTATEETGSWVEQWVKGVEIQREAIKYFSRHAITIQDYVQTVYYLTTAGIDYVKALKFANIALTTSIALREKAADTTRLLTGLYNVFGKTITDVKSDEEAFAKIAAILTATFREQDIEIQDYIKALPHAAEATRLAGVSIETLVAALGVMGTHFIRGSKGGTSFTRMLVTMIKAAQKYAEVTGKAFDPKKPLALVPILKATADAIESNREEAERFGLSAELFGKMMEAAGMRGQKAYTTLAANMRALAEQIERNHAATYQMVEDMAKLVEATPTKQLQILGNAIQALILNFVTAFLNARDLTEALSDLNDMLRSLQPLAKGLGVAIGEVAGSLERLIALVATWFIWTRRGIITFPFLRAWKEFSLTLRVLTGDFGKFLFSAAGLRVLLRDLGSLAASLGGTILRLGGIFLRTAGWIGLIYTAVMNLVSGIQYLTKSAEERKEALARYAVEDVATHKKWYEKITDYLDITKLHFMWVTREARKQARERLRILEEEYKKNKELAEAGKKKLEDVEREYRVKYLQIIKDLYKEITGKEASGEELRRFAIKAGLQDILQAEQEGAKARLEIQKWLDNELKKIELTRLGFSLWALKQTFDEKWNIIKGRSEEELRLRKWYSEKFFSLVSEYQNRALKSERSAADQIRRIHETGLTRDIRTVEENVKKYNEIFAKSGLQLLETQLYINKRRIEESKQTEPELLSVYEKAIEDLTKILKKEPEIGSVNAWKKAVPVLRRIFRGYVKDYKSLSEVISRINQEMKTNTEAGNEKITEAINRRVRETERILRDNSEWMQGITRLTARSDVKTWREAFEQRIKVTKEKLEELNRDEAILEERRAKNLREKRRKLNEQLTQLEKTYSEGRLKLSRAYETKWAEERAKALAQRYTKTELAWERELRGLKEFWQKVREEEDKRFQERVKVYEKGTLGWQKAERDHQEFLRMIRRAELEDEQELRRRNLRAYYEYYAHLKLLDSRYASDLKKAWKSRAEFLWNVFKAAASDFVKSSEETVRDWSELFKDTLDDAKRLTSEFLLAVIQGQEQSRDRMTRIWNEFLEALERRIADFLASRVWAELLSIFQGGGERKEERGEEVQDWIQLALGAFLSGLSKEGPKAIEAGMKAPGSPSAIERIGKSIAEASQKELTFRLSRPLTPATTVVTTPPVVVPAPQQQIAVLNVMDPNFIPNSMIRNKSVILNVISEDLLNRGVSYQIIKGL